MLINLFFFVFERIYKYEFTFEKILIRLLITV